MPGLLSFNSLRSGDIRDPSDVETCGQAARGRLYFVRVFFREIAPPRVWEETGANVGALRQAQRPPAPPWDYALLIDFYPIIQVCPGL